MDVCYKSASRGLQSEETSVSEAEAKTDAYTIEFNQAEIEKLKEIAAALKSAAGQKPEWVELADWLTDIVNEDEAAPETPEKPKKKKKKAY